MSQSKLTAQRPVLLSSQLGLNGHGLWPGLLLVLGLAGAAMALHHVIGLAVLSPLLLAMVFGIALRNSRDLPAKIQPGIRFAQRRILRLAIILLGFQLTLGQLYEVGIAGFAVAATVLAATFVFGKLAGHWLGVERPLSELIAAGTAVCGASAVIATNTVSRGSDEDVAYAIACVTLYGSVLMLGIPLVGAALDMEATRYGIWVGASVHEVAQVTAAAFQGGVEAGQVGTVTKLSRVILLAPLILSLGALARRRKGAESGGAAPTPWFVLGFVAVMLINSFAPLPEAAQGWMISLTVFLLTMSLAAMGLEADIRALRKKGARPLILGAVNCAFVAGLGLALVALL
ncbi:YeiH family protein [Pararhodobacter oceanensis]|uniref:YeiH family protein n=1 Tax=Pararhodobacter oceanensis TaxID=2172121 RepID=UPI003A93ED04